MKRQLIAGFALGLLAVVPAMAADMKAKPLFTKAPMMPVYTWTGAYIGLNAGYGWGDSEVATTTIFSPFGYFQATSLPAIAAAGAQTIKPNGFTGGGQIGYNWQASSVTVVGLEADFEYFGLKASSISGAVYPCCAPTAFTINQSVKTDWLATFRARLGYLVTPSALIYVTGGGAVTDLKGTFTFTDNNSAAAESGSFSSTKLGWTVGGGVEWTLWSGWSAKAEYLFVSFPSASVTSNNLTLGGTVPVPVNTFTHKADLDAHIARFGLNYKLGGMY
jgi:outer membrane immunogenic protein